MKFGATVTYSRLTWYLYNSAKTPIITKVLGAGAMGIYSMAATLASLPTQYITSLVIQTSVPLFSKMQNDPERLDNALRRLSSGIALLSFPIFLGMGLSAPELIPVVLGANWLEAIPILQVLCIIGLVKSVDPLITQAFFSVGKPNITASYTTLCAVTIPLSVYIGVVNGGLMGAAYALLISYPLSSIYLFVQARRHLHFSLRRYFKALQTPLEAALFMSAMVWLIALFWYQYLQLAPALVLLIKVIIGLLAYGGYLIYVRKEGLKDCHEVLLALGIKAEKLKRWPFNRLTK
jgi:O-antigen/teichoic acid export membrane protein